MLNRIRGFLRSRRKSALPKERVRAYEERLKEERARLLAEIQKRGKPQDFGGDVDSFEEEAEEAEALANQLSIAGGLRERVAEIDNALNSIRSGVYGVCEKCSGDIGEPLLDLVPESRLCANCKKEHSR